MTFESMWPLLFLIAVPVIIILYLLKPRGEDYRISSNLLWDKLLKNQHSKTFFEKFIHNILMYLQILITLILIFSFMSPYIDVNSTQGGRVIFLIDTSASMQHDNGSGITRLEEAIQTACDYVDASRNTSFSIVTHDDLGTELLAVGVSDKPGLKQTLRSIECTDASGTLSDAQGIIETLYVDVNEEGGNGHAHLIVLTDGTGADGAMFYTEYMDADMLVVGEPVNNIANDYTVYSVKEEGTDVVTQVTNYGSAAADFEVTLYSGEDVLLGVEQVRLNAGESTMCLFQNVDWDGDYLKSEISGIRFEGQGSGSSRGGDSLAVDNISYAVRSGGSLADGVLIGSGNTFIERAYRAVTGVDIIKADQDTGLTEQNYNIIIYDAGSRPKPSGTINRLCFADGSGALEELENVRLEVRSGELTAGLSDFAIGANRTYTYELPEWAVSFITSGDDCVAYYGEHDGIREIVVGFDIRETSFPLLAEFPVFMANAIGYLSDTSLLTSNIYYAGEQVIFQPQADIDVSTLEADTAYAGIYNIEIEGKTEYYVIRPETTRESDGLKSADTVSGTGEYSSLKVKQTLRNIFLIAALVLMIVEWLIYLKQMNEWKNMNRFYLTVRCIGWLLLILAILGITIPKHSDKVTTVFLVDLSESNRENVDLMERYLADTISEMPKDNRYGIIAFGRDAQIEQFLTDRKTMAGLMTVPDDTATNLEEAVYRAIAMIPSDSAGRLVLLTDGRETKGNVANTAGAIMSNDLELMGIILENEEGKDAYIEAVNIPSYLHPGDSYSVEVTVTSNYDTDAEISLISNDREIETHPVHLNRGSNRFVFSQTVTEENMESFQVVVTAPEDTCVENDAYHAYSIIEAAPRILLVAGRGENTSAMTEILKSAGCVFDVVSAKDVPSDINDMLAYKNIILQNVYLSDLPEGFLNELESYIADYGCGLICCGGEDSFALGGYRNTVMEEVLPVDMMLRGVDELPSTAMVMVVDHSGSMSSMALDGSGATNLDIAITAVVEAVNQLRPEDYVGVISFDDRYTWDVELTQAWDKDEIIDQVESIKEGGGTTIKPALEAAYNEILDCDVSVRHVVLLTDGMGETTDFDDIIRRYQRAGITLSTVAVGDGSDRNLLERLAENCGGRYYYSDISSDIPKIFAQEVFLSGDTYLQNGEFALQVRSSNEITAGLFTEGWPVLYGYVSSSPKGTANVLIASDKQDPILTVWQYGLGKTVAWNTDVTNQWTGGFAGNEDYIQLWRRIIDYSSGNTSLDGDNLDVMTVGDQTRIVYEAQNYTGQTAIEVVYSGPDGGEMETATLHATAPGRYEADLDTLGMGIYQLSVRRFDEGEITNAVTAAAAVQFADEYRFDISNANAVSYLEKYGILIGEDDTIWNKRSTRAKESYDLTDWLLAILILWFVFDIAVRRFRYVPRIRQRSSSASVVTGDVLATAAASGMAAVGSQMPDSAAGMKNSMSAVQQERPALQAAEPQAANQTMPGKTSKKAGKKPRRSEPETLDTAQLLKKKDERNIN